MKYTQFRNMTQGWPLIFSRNLLLHGEDSQVLCNQLERWRVKGLIIKLRRGTYMLNQDDRKSNPSRSYVANQLYSPSYISLEYALGLYDMIPERVSDLTSITTKKTQRFKNELGTFIYQHIKPQAFRGFKMAKDEAGLTYLVAEPEKAVVDLFYLNLDKFKDRDEKKVFEEFYRLQNLEGLRQAKIMEYARLFGNRRLARISRSLCKFIKEEKKR